MLTAVRSKQEAGKESHAARNARARSKAAGGVKVPMHLLESISQSILSKEVPTNFLRHFCHLHLRAWKMHKKNTTSHASVREVRLSGPRDEKNAHAHRVRVKGDFDRRAPHGGAAYLSGSLSWRALVMPWRWRPSSRCALCSRVLSWHLRIYLPRARRAQSS